MVGGETTEKHGLTGTLRGLSPQRLSPQSLRTVHLESGKTIGNYRVVRSLGSGGMGTVYEAEHISLGVTYALKVFSPEGKNSEFLRKRFLAEGKILARLRHPRIVRVYDMGETDDFVWFTMDFVAGADGRVHTLADMPQAGLIPEKQIARWYDDVCEALDVVHAAGIVHRDVKLENVLVGRDGRAVLSDFGISRIIDEDLRRQLAVTRTMVAKDVDMKVVLGTAAYLAPEIRSGGEPTAATDWYALGVAFFRLLTGMWYESGPHAFDLLTPFSHRWRDLFTALLASDPKDRQAPRYGRQSRRGWWIAAGIAALLALTAVPVALMLANNSSDADGETEEATACKPISSEPEENPFDIPETVK